MRLYQFTHRAVAAPGVVAPERAPRLQGLARGLGGGACVGGSHGSGGCLDALGDESSGAGDGQVLRSVVAVVHRAGRASAPAGLARLDRLPGAPAALSVPRARTRGPADDAAGEQVHNEGGAARAPCRVGTRVLGSAARRRSGWAAAGVAARAGRAGPGSRRRARWCGSSCPPRRRPDSGALLPGARQPPGLPGIPDARVEAARPTRGGDPLLDLGAASEIERADGGLLRAA